MIILQIILLSTIFTTIFITLHFLFLHFLSFTKTMQTIYPFVLGNFICFLLTKNFVIYELIYHSFILNITILVIYIEFLLLIKMGFTISILLSFNKVRKLLYKEITKKYSSGKGDKWILINRLNSLKKVKIINLNKNISLNKFGYILSIIIFFLRKIFSVKDFG
jgi:hypothetical protein